jgi:hypothetical protein
MGGGWNMAYGDEDSDFDDADMDEADFSDEE